MRRTLSNVRRENIRVVGLGGLEPPTSPLSGARSSHLSYRPQHRGGTAHKYLIVRWFSVFRNCAEISVGTRQHFSEPLTAHDVQITFRRSWKLYGTGNTKMQQLRWKVQCFVPLRSIQRNINYIPTESRL